MGNNYICRMGKKNEEELRIRGLCRSLKKNVDNIAANTGVTKSSILKPVIQAWVDSQPEHLKRDPMKD